MSWDTVIDQRRAVETLRRAIERGRVAHAYLFHGPDGVGKKAAALAFARALQCEEAGPDSCGACTACRKVERMVHPDVHVILPQPRGADAEEVGERLQLLGKNPYATVDFMRRPALDDPEKTSNKQVWIHVDRIRSELQAKVRYRPLEGAYTFALLVDADRMNPEAANAFLKLLEEPGPEVVLVLTTSKLDVLLPTILSRCQHVRFDPLSSKAIEEALVARQDSSSQQAVTLGRMADGSYARALELAQRESLQAQRQLALDFIRSAYIHDIDKLSDQVEQMKRMGREPVKQLLGLVISWLRDVVLYRNLEDAEQLVNIDQQEAIVRFSEAVAEADLEGMVQLSEEAIRLIQRNVRVDLVLMALAHALWRAMRGEAPGELYVPLAAPPRVGGEARAA